ncbi:MULTISPECIES: hypothetical protein [Sphingobacterium]|uniref:hypothetical protein n=1 Tax=Sphingobacterium TaxID=28453 RepID=UPI0013DCAD9A|nr:MULTISPECIES: hypothetical protein [unclassified Sphingobacterium]
MKRILYIITLISLVVVSACRKSDNATMLDGIVYLNEPIFKKVLQNFDESIAFQDPLAFKGKFTVGLKYNVDAMPKYLDIVVTKNRDTGKDKPYPVSKKIRTNVTSFPEEVEITGQQIVDLFGAIALGDNYDIGANYITEDGKEYEAFPLYGDGYGAGVASQGGSNPTIRYSCICTFDMDEFLGDGKFETLVDGWEDFGVGTVVDVKKVDEETFEIVYPIAGYNNIKVVVNPGDNSISVAKQPLGAYPAPWPYGVYSVESKGGAVNNYLNPCEGTIKINGSYTVSAGGFGEYVLELKKK